MKDTFENNLTGGDWKMIAALIFILVTVLAACSSTSPPALLTCKEEPRDGGRPDVSAADLLEFTDQVAVAGADCRSKLKAVKKIVGSR